MLVQRYDALVVGARIAGATVAALLGDAGYRVLLVDRASFPSATLSSHFFRGAGLLAVLARLHLLDRVLALDAPLLEHCYYYNAQTATPLVGPPQEPGALGFDLSVRREVLDALLFQRVRCVPSVETAERTSVVALLLFQSKGVFPLNIRHHSLAYRHVDVFSKTPFSGNGLTVFPESSGLPVEIMQRITQKMRQFESILLDVEPSSSLVRASIFTMEEELDFAGHPVLGAACVLHELMAENRQQAQWLYLPRDR